MPRGGRGGNRPSSTGSSDARSSVESHYDAQANLQVSRKAYMQQRREGPLIKYKEFANNVKRRMFKAYAHRAASLLDLGCGRGGDLSKWREAEVQRVLGMDLLADQLEDARRRAKDGGARNTTQLEWMQGSLVDHALEEKLRPKLPDAGGADAVAIMFAVQFAFRTIHVEVGHVGCGVLGAHHHTFPDEESPFAIVREPDGACF